MKKTHTTHRIPEYSLKRYTYLSYLFLTVINQPSFYILVNKLEINTSRIMQRRSYCILTSCKRELYTCITLVHKQSELGLYLHHVTHF